MKTIIQKTILLLLVVSSVEGWAQNDKFWISGAARNVMYGDRFENQAENDTTTPRNLQSGHTMVDLGVNINPHENVLIQGMVRIRNDYGGFWGSGVTFDVRQLNVKGIISNVVKYQLGDIDYRMTPYTFYNNPSLVNRNPGNLTGVPLNQVQYDLFYFDNNTWRQQGAAAEFALQFNQFVEELEVNLFTTRIRSALDHDGDDRLFSGGSAKLIQSDFVNLSAQYANLWDYQGTSNNTEFLRNPVWTSSFETAFKYKDINFNAALETGRSQLTWVDDPEAPLLEDFFYDAQVKAEIPAYGLRMMVGYRDVGADFRSAGAQSLQINFNRNPRAYGNIGNAQNLRGLTMLDLYRDPSLYQMQIREGLQAYDPRYDNATPYGRATPNRRGLNGIVNYEDLKKRWMIEGETEILRHVVGEGTEALKQFITNTVYAELRLHEVLKMKDRKFVLSSRVGFQNTTRSGNQDYESVDLATQFQQHNLTLTLFGNFDFIAEWNTWQTQGMDLMAIRNSYSVIRNFSEFAIDYNESIRGIGMQYRFTEKTNLHFLWQTFNWNEADADKYMINTWTVFFTMNF